MTFGEKNPKKPNKTILLVGETGAGKSTLVNSLVNYTMGVKWEDDVWFQIIEEENKSQAENQTSDVIIYEIFGFEDETLPYSLTIIDTPGYATRKIIGHAIISHRLLELFQSEDGVHEINAVGLVMKATDNRVNDRLMYVLDSAMSLFGKDLEKNIVALITHSDGRKPKNAFQALEAANVKCAKNGKNEPFHFMFDNCLHEDRTQEATYFKTACQISEKGMREFTAFMESSLSQKLKITVEVLNKRIRLTDCINNLQHRIELTDLKQTEIKQNQKALMKHEEEMKTNKNFTVEVYESYKEKEVISGGMCCFNFCSYDVATCCTVCKETCHYPCTKICFSKCCEKIVDGRCTVCTKNCRASAHEKVKWIYVTETRKVVKTNEEMKEKFEKNESESENKSSLLENLKKEMKQLTAETSELLHESYQHVVSLEQIALKADSASTIVHLDYLIEKMKEKEDIEKVQKLEKMRRRVNDGTRSAMRYKQYL